MERRFNRRMLVVATYFFLAAVTVAICSVVPGTLGWRCLYVQSGNMLVIALICVMRGVFGALVAPEGFEWLIERRTQVVDRGMGLAATVPPDEPEPDEFDIALRNSAYFAAYRGVAVYVLVLLFLVSLVLSSHIRAQMQVIYVSVFMLVALIFTLPQAVLLWTQRELIAKE